MEQELQELQALQLAEPELLESAHYLQASALLQLVELLQANPRHKELSDAVLPARFRLPVLQVGVSFMPPDGIVGLHE